MRTVFGIAALALCLFALASETPAQGRGIGGIFGDKLVEIQVGEITLEAIDFRSQTARLNVGLDVGNAFMPVRLKDFDYRLSLFDRQLIEGHHNGTLKVGGREPARVNLPVEVHLRSIPGVVWNAFSNRGNVRYQLDTGFTVPLLVFNKRFDTSFSGEVPLKSVVDAATILRARGMGGTTGRGLGGILQDIWQP